MPCILLLLLQSHTKCFAHRGWAAAGVHSTAPAPNFCAPAIPVSSGPWKARLFLWPRLELWGR